MHCTVQVFELLVVTTLVLLGVCMAGSASTVSSSPASALSVNSPVPVSVASSVGSASASISSFGSIMTTDVKTSSIMATAVLDAINSSGIMYSSKIFSSVISSHIGDSVVNKSTVVSSIMSTVNSTEVKIPSVSSQYGDTMSHISSQKSVYALTLISLQVPPSVTMAMHSSPMSSQQGDTSVSASLGMHPSTMQTQLMTQMSSQVPASETPVMPSSAMSTQQEDTSVSASPDIHSSAMSSQEKTTQVTSVGTTAFVGEKSSEITTPSLSPSYVISSSHVVLMTTMISSQDAKTSEVMATPSTDILPVTPSSAIASSQVVVASSSVSIPVGTCAKTCVPDLSDCIKFDVGGYKCKCKEGYYGNGEDSCNKVPVTFLAKLKFKDTFVTEYADVTSEKFHKFANRIETELNKTFHTQSSFLEAKVTGLKEGSVIADVNLYFKNNPPNNTAVNDILIDASKKLNGTVSSQAQVVTLCDIYSCEENEECSLTATKIGYTCSCKAGFTRTNGVCDEDEDKFLILYIVLGVAGGVILLALLIAVILFCCRRRGKQSYHVDYGKYVYYNASVVELEDIDKNKNVEQHPDSHTNGNYSGQLDQPNGSGSTSYRSFKPGQEIGS